MAIIRLDLLDWEKKILFVTATANDLPYIPTVWQPHYYWINPSPVGSNDSTPVTEPLTISAQHRTPGQIQAT
jgi:hypothetical protein